ncbi:MAG: plasminogen-binding N-terminal domain-containing protein [Sulfurovum sp.]|jgi:hypothetical protein|nr:MAG: Plasminogen-binding protein PgbA [Arcobacter lacus]
MIKSISKILFAASIVALSAISLDAKNIVCYKNNTTELSNIENIPFDGEGCNGKYSITDMKQMGWKIIDIKIFSRADKFDYKYLLSDMKSQAKKTQKTSFSPDTMVSIIDNLDNNKTTIKIPNLIVGQSGVVIHKYGNNKNIIVANAKVINSDVTSSTLEFSTFDGLKQDAIPTSNRKVQKGDTLALNYLYTNSLLITPSQDVFQAIRKKFSDFTFEHSDIFASYLKFNNTPKPTILDIQEYAKSKDLGTIFIVVDQKVNILDTRSLNLLDSYFITYDDTSTRMPFYTRVSGITSLIPEVEGIKGLINKLISKIQDDEETKDINSDNYEDYYKFQIGL